MHAPDAAPDAAQPHLDRLRAAPVSCALGLALVAVFVAMARAGVFAVPVTGQALLAWGADFGPAVFDRGEPWRLVTSVFVHVGVLHLLMNLWGLWALGPESERRLGTVTFLAAFLLFGIAGSLLSIAAHPMAAGAGASGALFGLDGLELAALVRRADPLTQEERRKRLRRLVSYLVVTALFFAATDVGDNAAHAGGLVAGLGFGLWVLRPSPLPVRSAGARAAALGALGLLLVLVGGAASLRVPEPTPAFQQDGLAAAYAHLEAGEPAQALALANAALSAGVRPGDAYLMRALAQEQLRMPQAAIVDYGKVLEAQGNMVYARDRRCYLRSHLEAAAEVLEECTEAARVPGLPGYSAQVGLARVLLALQRPKEALAAAQRAAALYPQEGEPTLLEGWAQLALKELKLAQAAFQKGGAAGPAGEVEAVRGQVAVARARGQTPAALALLDQALQRRPDDVLLLTDRADQHYRAGRLEAGLADLDRVVTLKPDWALGHNNRAWYLLAAGRASEALTPAERATSLEPQNTYVRGTRCWVREALGDWKGALEDCSIAARANPAPPSDKGMLALLQGAPLQQVKAHWAEAAKTRPEDRPLFERTLARARRQRASAQR